MNQSDPFDRTRDDERDGYLVHVEYNELPVPEGLTDVMRCAWTLVDNGVALPADTEPILPDGCAELILNRALPFEARMGRTYQRQPQRFVHGQLTRALHLRPNHGCDIVGMRLQPHGAYALFGPAAVLADATVDLATLGSEVDARFRSALEHSSASARMAEVFRVLAELPRHPVERAITDLVARIEHGSDEHVLKVLKAQVPLSVRQVERRFVAVVGLRPKVFARIVRLRRLIDGVRADGSKSFTQLAHAAGYYDQAHFNRDLKAFTGLAPSAYFGQDLMLPPYFSGVH